MTPSNGQGHSHSHGQGHSHSHGLVDRSIVRSRAGIRAVSFSLGVLAVTALVQVVIFALSGSVALLADLIHNVGDALTAVPLGIAFFLRSFRGEKLAGLAVVLAIFVSACVALYETIQRLIHPQDLVRRDPEPRLERADQLLQSAHLHLRGLHVVQVTHQAHADRAGIHGARPLRWGGRRLQVPARPVLHLTVLAAVAVADEEMIRQSL
jgi:hypothetical protein